MFRPCIDLHDGKVKQIVGGSLSDSPESLRTNFVSDKPARWYADLYRRDGLVGGHIVMLGPGNDESAREALSGFPGGLQIGGGINLDNARSWLDSGASHVIVTSWVFREGQLDESRLKDLAQAIGRNRLVLDLSCRLRDGFYRVVTNRWQTFANLKLERETFAALEQYACEFLVHAVDVEGQCLGVDLNLVRCLSQWCSVPVTYAGGARSMADLESVTSAGQGRVDLTIGSALDIFGGKGVLYADVVAHNRRMANAERRATTK